MKALKCLFLSFVFLLTLLPASPPVAAQGRNQSVGLVLSGGGAKGIAHIGVIKALEENNIPIDFITGTSMGAIVGGLYACGYTPEEMMDLITSEYFTYMSTGRIDPEMTYYFAREPASPQMFSLPLGRRDSLAMHQRFNPRSLIASTPMAFGFMELFGAPTAQCDRDFNNLFVPFRCVASDVTKRRKMVLGHGNVGDAIRASMSFPLVFQAVEIDGNILYDGGIYDNFPVDVMREEFSPSVILGVSVNTPDDTPPNSYMQQLELLVMQPQDYLVPEEDGMKVHVKLTDIGLLDFGAAEQIYERGYNRAYELMDSIKSRVTARETAESRSLRRAIYKSATPALRFDNVVVEGGTKAQNDYIRYLFRPAAGEDTIGITTARRAFYRALSSGKLASLQPQATLGSDTTDMFTLNLTADVKNKFSIGVGGFITSSNNSFLYLRGGYSSLSFSSVNTQVEAWIGQSYMAGAFTGMIYVPARVPSAFTFEAVASRRRYYESEKLFFRDNEPSFLVNHEYFGRVGWCMATGRLGKLSIGIGGGRLDNSFYQSYNEESYRSGRDHVALNLGQAIARFEASTLDDINYPTSGFSYSGVVAGLAGRTHLFQATLPEAFRKSWYNELWVQANLRTRNYFTLHRHWALGVEGQLVLSTRKLMSSYYASISTATPYEPTPAAHNVFDSGLRANNFLALNVVPVWKINDQFSARFLAGCFMPWKRILDGPSGLARYGEAPGTPSFFGEFDLAYHLPFATVSGYCNYSTTTHSVNGGISLGIYVTAPKFLR